MSKLLTVVGATGVQGGSVLSAFVNDPAWRLRGLTRNPQSPSAKKAAAAFPSVEWLAADLNDPSSLTRAFADSHAVFAVTSAFDPSLASNRAQETQQGRNMADAAALCHVTYLVWSTLPDTRELSHHRYTSILHTFLKADVDRYITAVTVPSTTSSSTTTTTPLTPLFIRPGSYCQNYLYRFPPRRDADGTVVFSLPAPATVKLDLLDINDLGRLIHTLISSPSLASHYSGHHLTACAERLTGDQLASTYTDVTGEAARYEEMGKEAFVEHVGDEAVGKELYEMFQYYAEFGLFGDGLDVDEVRRVYPRIASFRQMLQRTGFREGQRDERFES